jgi:hypothetical protein
MLSEDEIRERFAQAIVEQCVFNIFEDGFDYEYGSVRGSEKEIVVDINKDVTEVEFETDRPQEIVDFVSQHLNTVRFALGTICDIEGTMQVNVKILNWNIDEDIVRFGIQISEDFVNVLG